MWPSEGLDFALPVMATDGRTECPTAKAERWETTPAAILQREPCVELLVGKDAPGPIKG